MCEKGFLVLSPESEHSPFDVVGYKNNKFVRIQVKYRHSVEDALEIQARTVWVDMKGYHINYYKKTDIDYYCIYCPETNECYYIKANLVHRSFTLRLKKPKNNQYKNVNMSKDYLTIRLSK